MNRTFSATPPLSTSPKASVTALGERAARAMRPNAVSNTVASKVICNVITLQIKGCCSSSAASMTGEGRWTDVTAEVSGGGRTGGGRARPEGAR